ncbi:MAG: LysM peptidoglycan-binding domain-containing protein [Anaerolineae bacterium]|nr:LysM peptidoglycan-binding domain-containing protein [Anaerolineae bacterium]
MKRYRRVFLVLLLVTSLTLAVPAAAQTGGMQHVVARGETLFRIALRYGVTVDALSRYNGVANPNRIYAGQVLMIPDGSVLASSAPVAQPAPAAASGGTHVVQRGEHLAMIGRQYGVSAQAIAAANGIGNPNLIFAGQRLIIPGAGAPAPSAPVAQPAASSATGTHVVQRGEYLAMIGRQYGGERAGHRGGERHHQPKPDLRRPAARDPGAGDVCRTGGRPAGPGCRADTGNREADRGGPQRPDDLCV